MHVLDDFLIYYLQRFDKYCFDVVICGKEYRIGKGEPVFLAALFSIRIFLRRNS